MMLSNELFPDIMPYKKGFLPVSEQHRLYFEESGNSDGYPVVFLHEGPGAGCSSRVRRLFDPNFYRIILFDQRGAGRSEPVGCLDDNTTQHLVEDLEKLRQHLHADQWVLVGEGWGCTLALTYAVTYPCKVLGLILRSVFLGREAEKRWFYQAGGAHQFFPEAWEQFVELIPEQEQDDLIKAYYLRLTQGDEEEQGQAASAWNHWQTSTMPFEYRLGKFEALEDRGKALSLARIEAHYFANNCFFESDDWLLTQVADKLQHLPCIIIHSRYDVVSPVQSAWDLAKVLPNADLQILQSVGHTSHEACVIQGIISATESFKDLYLQGKNKIAIDFDGVLHRYSKGWQDGSIYDDPIDGAREAMQRLKELGYYLIIFSTRANRIYRKKGHNPVREMQQWLRKHQIPYHEICTTGKPRAQIYVDDRALAFKGNWDDTVAQVQQFVVWRAK
ncbi:prolyl aminopeptidase [Eisenibacter elegans]|uniref:prolyl aminopeptidase n=1 Tax=Eisenibacter elegans TaxID=997 RepID=UPI0009D74DA4|nr:prolyl aminopeptidase [Eisenibacter elegans]